MQPTLIILAKPRYHRQVIDWFLVNKGEVTNHGEASLSELYSLSEFNPKEIVIVPAVEYVHARLVDVKHIKDRHLRNSIPYIMEPFLGNTIDENLISYFKSGNDVFGMAISKQDLHDCQALAKLFPETSYRVVPIQCGIVQFEEEQRSNFIFLGQQLSLEPDGQICFCPTDVQAKQNKFDHEWPTKHLIELANNKLPSLIAEKVKSTRTGIFSWKIAAGLMMCLGTTALYSVYYEANQYLLAADKLRSEISEEFAKLFPDEKLVSLVRQVQIKASEGGSSINSGDRINAYDSLQKLENVAVRSQESSLVSVAFDRSKREVTFDLLSHSLDANSAFANRLINFGGTVTLSETKATQSQFLSSYNWSTENDK